MAKDQPKGFRTALLLAEHEASPDGILVVDEAGKIISYNRRFVEMWRVPPDVIASEDDREAIQAVLHLLKDPDAFVARVNQIYAKPDDLTSDELELTDDRVFERHSAPVRGPDGSRYGRVWYFRDITASRRLEAELRAARDEAMESSRAKSRFLANVSHELRTPLHAIQAMCEVMSRDSLSPAQAERASIAHASVRSLALLIDGLLDFSKLEAGAMALDRVVVDPRQALESAVAVFREQAEAKGLRFEVDFTGPMPAAVEADPLRLGQVVSNLVNNAVKFTEKGHVRVEGWAEPEGPGFARLRVVVKDSGVGVAADALGRLFKPFSQGDASTTRRFGGTGLGLAISRRLAELMGGAVALESVQGSGSVATFTAPLKIVAASDVPEPSEAAPAPRLDALRILVVEDNSVNRRVARDMLRLLGAAVQEAADGAQALAALDKERFDLVLMDCSMPVLDGYEAVRELRRREAGEGRTPVVAMTAHASPEDRTRCLDAGMDDYLPKPVKLDELAAAIFRWTTCADPARLAEATKLAGADWPHWRAEYLADARRLLAEVRSSGAEGRDADRRRAAHTLKGASAALGLKRLAAIAGRLEEPRFSPELLVEAERELERAARALG